MSLNRHTVTARLDSFPFRRMVSFESEMFRGEQCRPICSSRLTLLEILSSPRKRACPRVLLPLQTPQLTQSCARDPERHTRSSFCTWICGPECEAATPMGSALYFVGNVELRSLQIIAGQLQFMCGGHGQNVGAEAQTHSSRTCFCSFQRNLFGRLPLRLPPHLISLPFLVKIPETIG